MFQKIAFQIVLLFSKLPLKVLYLLSNFMYYFNFYLVGYRKKEVLENLKNSFPEQSYTELLVIRKKFYRYFSDYIVETLKSFSISETELKVRVQHINRDLFSQAKEDKKNIILLTGHVFNWEWFTALATLVPQKNCYPVYRKMQNSFWNEKIKNIRNANGNQSLEAREVIKNILKSPNDGNSIYMFVADQTPHISEVNFGLNFLNQKTPVFIGYDKLATKLDLVFFYCEMKRVKRGYYQVNYYKMEPENEKFKEFEIVEQFHHYLEKTINKNPENYLWSHRKWKYKHAIKNYK